MLTDDLPRKIRDRRPARWNGPSERSRACGYQEKTAVPFTSFHRARRRRYRRRFFVGVILSMDTTRVAANNRGCGSSRDPRDGLRGKGREATTTTTQTIVHRRAGSLWSTKLISFLLTIVELLVEIHLRRGHGKCQEYDERAGGSHFRTPTGRRESEKIDDEKKEPTTTTNWPIMLAPRTWLASLRRPR